MNRRVRSGLQFAFAAMALGGFSLPADSEEPQPSGPGWQIARESGRPRLFQPGVISRSADECRPAFDLWVRGGWAYFATGTIETPGVTIMVSRFDPLEKRWLKPHPADQFAGHAAADPFITPDGSRIYFASNRGKAGRPQTDFDIWETHRNGAGWSEPTRLAETVNSPGNEASPWEAGNGTLYFTSDRAGGRGGTDGYRCRSVNGAYLPAENLGETVNTPFREPHLCVDPQERWMLVASDRPGGLGGFDLWVCLADSAGHWGPAVDVQAPVNSAADELGPVLWWPPGERASSGGTQSFLFFSTSRLADLGTLRTSGQYRGPVKGADAPGNGRADIYQASPVTLGIPLDRLR